MATPEAIEGRRPRVLVVDDDKDVLFTLEKALSRNFDVTPVDTATDVVAKVKELRPDMLLLDYCMPKMDGMTVCRSIRRLPECDDMPVVFLSAMDAEESRVAAYDAGAQDFIAKPFDIAELRAKVDVWTQLSKRSAKLVARNRELQEMAIRDSLTGLVSRRHILEVLDRELSRVSRTCLPLSLLLIDVDDFKSINDTFGHAAGDEALRATARYLRQILRRHDFAARYGGDEFLVLLPDTSLKEAEQVCQKLQSEAVPWRHENTRSMLSLSIGAAEAPGAALTSSRLIEAADMAMLLAKKRGKGRYHIHRNGSTDLIKDYLHQERSAGRTTVRESVCRLIGRLLAQASREGDVLASRSEILLGLSDRLGRNLEMSPPERVTLRNAARLVGYEQAGLPFEIASARGGLQPHQRQIVRETMEENLRLLRTLDFLTEEAETLQALHEWWDGSGLPRGAAGEAIPPLARHLAVLSAFTLLLEGGPHTDSHPWREAYSRIEIESGTHFDPKAVEALRPVLEGYFSTEHRAGKGEILLVDDHPPLVKVLRKRLEGAGYSVGTATTAAEGRRLFPERRWSAVLLDVMLPDGDGLALCRELRESPLGEAVPIAILTCRSDQACLDGAQTAGAHACFVKPLRFESLLRFLRDGQDSGEACPFRVYA